jgi:hypothetical protein
VSSLQQRGATPAAAADVSTPRARVRPETVSLHAVLRPVIPHSQRYTLLHKHDVCTDVGFERNAKGAQTY